MRTYKRGLKPVNPRTQKGLSKLPTEVRNKMGYMKKGGVTKKKKTKAEANFKPHTMYDKKTGKGVRAGTFKKHLDLKKKGYGHTKPRKRK